MHTAKWLILTILCASGAFANEKAGADFYQLKMKIDQMAFDAKIEREHQKIIQSGKFDFDFSVQKDVGSLSQSINIECAKWVYQGPGTREDAIRACKGVRNMECVKFVYQGASSRQESAIACRGVKLQECVEWVYQGPGSREEAANACRGVTDMKCLEFVYQGPSSRMEAAKICSEGSRDHDRCE